MGMRLGRLRPSGLTVSPIGLDGFAGLGGPGDGLGLRVLAVAMSRREINAREAMAALSSFKSSCASRDSELASIDSHHGTPALRPGRRARGRP